MNILQSEAEKLMKLYSEGEYLESLKKAKEVFVEKTGKIDEDSYEYESRMSSFNDWYLFQYQMQGGDSVIEKHLEKADSATEVEQALANSVYSVFVFHKINFRKQVVIKDVLHNTKFVLSKDNGNLPLVEDDVFIGRMVEFEGQNYLLNGLCILPKEVLSSIKKECKKIRKNKLIEEDEFLLNLERLKTKSLQYGHIDPTKIFIF